MDKISIIIPCYNGAMTLNRCLDAVAAQDYTNYEVLIINDGSKDDSCDIILKYTDKDKRFVLINKENGGVSSARNVGIAKATGKYICFLDCDDNYLVNDYLTRMMNAIKTNKADMAVCNFTHPCFNSYLPGRVYDLRKKTDFYTFYQEFFAFGVPWNKLFHRKLLESNFDETIKIAEDELFFLSNIKNIKKIAVLDDVIHNYYCAPPGAGQMSAINALVAKEGEIKSLKNSIWYIAVDLMDRHRQVLEKSYKQYLGDLLYVRTFDFLFIGYYMMIHKGASVEMMIDDLKDIFKHKVWQDTLKSKEKYGVFLKAMSDIEMSKKVSEFMNVVEHTIKNVENKQDININKILMGLYGKMFCTYDIDELDRVDSLANAIADMACEDTAEVKFIRHLNLKKEDANND